MDIIVVSHERGRTWRFRWNPRSVISWLPIVAVGLTVCGAVFAAGYSLRGEGTVVPASLLGAWTEQAEAERLELEQIRAVANEDANALSRRIALLQAHVMRLDAAGERLTQMADLDIGEFDFSSEPPMGGPEGQNGAADSNGLELALTTLEEFERKLSDRERQMRVLEDLLLASRLQKQVLPAGWPVNAGYISSTFGRRTDPFNGRSAMHAGVDFAGRSGANVVAVASGIVSVAGTPKGYGGYGQVVEINHGNGYVTRYGHNKKILVKVGDRVERGHPVALMGSTGRSTGTHVHFEVLLNGKVVNPMQYIQAAR